VLALEAVLLGAAALAITWNVGPTIPDARARGLVILLGAVMGMQSAAVRQVHLAGVWTTFITGTLTEWVAGLVERTPAKELPVGRVQAAVYATYGLAALATAWLQRRGSSWAIALPWLVLLGVVACSAWRMRHAGRS
jgi:uncharacterized membrane protein YoaK (UPF0700 family)